MLTLNITKPAHSGGARVGAAARWLVAALVVFGGVGSAGAQTLAKTPDLARIDITEHLGAAVPLDQLFRDERGQTIALRELLPADKPLVLTLAYYQCPMLCTMVLNGLCNAVKTQSLRPGTDFQMVTVSIDPTETPELAAGKRANYLGTLGLAAESPAWRFLTGEQPAITALADALGFRYFRVPDSGEFAHPAAVFVITPDGHVSRYLYGITFRGLDLKLALLDAGAGKIGSIVDRVIMYCYHYDPNRGSYALMAFRVMRLGGLATLVLLVAFLGWWWRREWRLRQRVGESVIEQRAI